MAKLINFLSAEDGAVTVDFVVLTAAICTLGFIVVSAFDQSTTDLANGIETKMDDFEFPQ